MKKLIKDVIHRDVNKTAYLQLAVSEFLTGADRFLRKNQSPI
jgi:hypothetical protein